MIKTRFAPSPTGYLHIGGARTALFSWLYARKHGGHFALRIEDTDRERSTAESTQAILEGMDWLGLQYDEGPIYQSDRFERYQQVIDELLKKGLAYRCDCSKERLDELRQYQMSQKIKPRYDGHCRNRQIDPSQPHVIRFRNPDQGEVIIQDLVRGEIRFQNQELDDLILQRSDGSPTYHLTVVVDDADMGISHIIRGDDHINNTPRQINLLKALEWPIPQYAHLPMILGADGSRLSKRHGAVSVLQYREEGYLPEALLNYLVRLGWSYGDQEIFSLDEMIQLFELNQVNKSASIFNPDKLLWLNQHYIKHLPVDYIAERLAPYLQKLNIDTRQGPDLIRVTELQRERAKTLVELAQISAFYYQDFDQFEPKTAQRVFKKNSVQALQTCRDHLKTIAWHREAIHAAIKKTADGLSLGFGKVAMPLRIAITGGSPAPDLDLTMEMVGQAACLKRIDKAIDYIQSQQG